MSRGAWFAVTSAGLIGLAAVALRIAYATPAAGHAVLVAAGVALATQGAAWVILRSMGRREVIAAWGLGALLRVVVLVLFSIVGPRWLGLPLEAATLSLAVFLFVTTLVEPLFLKS